MPVTFAAPHVLWALVVLPALALLEWRAVGRARRAALLVAGERPGNALLAQRRPRERVEGLALRLAALALLVVGAAGPEWGREVVRRASRGSDLVFVIDISQSMDARDVAPSRLEEARREALALLDRAGGSRIAVLVFAGDAVRLCPLTQDRNATRLVLQTLSTSLVSTPGTDLGQALRTALRLLPAGRREEQGIVLWTDGEDLEGGMGPALAEARASGVRVFAVGVGTPAGDVIPVANDAGIATDVKRDETGQIVRSRLDEGMLRDLARSTRGAYFAASQPGGQLGGLVAAMGSLAQARRGARLVERPVARFGWFAFAAALLLLAEGARARRRDDRAARARAVARVAAACLAGAALAGPARTASAQSAWARGDAAFRAGAWTRAESLYAQRARHGAPAPVQVNLATARARLGRAGADRELSHLTAQPGRAGQAAGYNLGTLYGERKDYDRALGELRRALERDPNDADARWNYELLARERDKAQANSARQPKAQQPSPPQPQPSSPGARGGAGGQPPPSPGANAPRGQAAPSPSTGTTRGSAGVAPGMSREQAEKLLGSLEELERLEKQRARQGRAMRERKGKDW